MGMYMCVGMYGLKMQAERDRAPSCVLQPAQMLTAQGPNQGLEPQPRAGASARGWSLSQGPSGQPAAPGTGLCS